MAESHEHRQDEREPLTRPKSRATSPALVSVDLVQTHVVILTAAYLYVVGWTFSYYYYDFYRVSVHSLGIPVYSIFIFTFSVLLYDYNSIPVAGLIIISAAALSISKRWNPILRSAILVLVIVISFVLLFLVAESAGEKTARERLTDQSLHHVRLALTAEGASGMTSDFNNANSAGTLMQVFEAGDALYLATGHTRDDLKTFVIPRKLVLEAEVR